MAFKINSGIFSWLNPSKAFKIVKLHDYHILPEITKMFGFELEFFLIDNDGGIINKADMVIKDLQNKLLETQITHEASKAMIELNTFPHISSREVFGKFFKDFESLLYEMETNDIGLFYYGTYPGKNTAEVVNNPRYDAKTKIIGKEEFSNEGKCCGFHYHYSLPAKSFNPHVKFFYLDILSQKKQKILNLFNLYIALDPAIITFMQSSPYFEGRLLGKDARIIMYRGDPFFNFQKAVYAKYPEFGTLNEYAPTFDMMVSRIKERTSKWQSLLKEEGFSFEEFAKKDVSLLDASWKPVRISTHGTIESRGCDMNCLSKVFGISNLLKKVSKFVEERSIFVTPSEIGNIEPFKLEGDTLYVPEMPKLVGLQRYSATEGFENKEVLSYCKGLLKLYKTVVGPNFTDSYIKVLYDMTDKESTTSEDIINFVKKKQGSENISVVEDETARSLAIKSADKLYKEIILTKKLSEKY